MCMCVCVWTRSRTHAQSAQLGPVDLTTGNRPAYTRMSLYTRVHTQPRPVPLPSALEAAVVDSFDRIKSALPPLISYQRLGNERNAFVPRRAAPIRSILILPDYTRRYAKPHTRVSTPREPVVPLNLNGRNELN
ncbi:hypothetical protein X777_15939 [Ooceraea biroi]|uniref:Uncharacterized protein n=1 Tax=Ooceraea biroi TaxID=2015173 RepID=A0A026WTA4_OOCBI|nr:hypothetical protein X777_15939 [Ooceraea biroi]